MSMRAEKAAARAARLDPVGSGGKTGLDRVKRSVHAGKVLIVVPVCPEASRGLRRDARPSADQGR